MMFASTLTFTINGDERVLNRINQDGYSSEYYLRLSDRDIRLFIRNSTINDKRRPGVVVEQHNVELVETVYAVSPSPNNVRRCFLTFFVQQGDDIAESGGGPIALMAWLSASSGAAITSLTGFAN